MCEFLNKSAFKINGSTQIHFANNHTSNTNVLIVSKFTMHVHKYLHMHVLYTLREIKFELKEFQNERKYR